MKLKTKIILGTIGLILVFSIILFIVSIRLGYSPDYLTKIVCKEQPYEVIEHYNEQEPYTTTEYYYEQEPYTERERYCNDRSWLTGDCVSWDYRSITKYKDVEKSRTITKYRNVQKTRTITKYAQVCLRVYLWKSVDFSKNWLKYPEIYDNQENKLTLPYVIA